METSKHMPIRKEKRLFEIDLFRFIAALAVVFFHFGFRSNYDHFIQFKIPFVWDLAKYGYLGVELFFIISGFVILHSVLNANLSQFFISRVTRLYPAFWVGCTLTSICMILWHREGFDVHFVQYLINMTMLNGFVQIPPIDVVYWTLFVELRFYLMIAVLIVFRQIHRIEFWATLWFVSTLLVAMTPLQGQQISVFKLLKFINIQDFSPYFIAGIFFHQIWQKGLNRNRLMMILLCLLYLLSTSMQNCPDFLVQTTSYNPAWVVGLIHLMLFGLFFALAVHKTHKLRRKQWIVFGAMTYPLYLIHQNIGILLLDTFTAYLRPTLNFTLTLTLVLALAFLIHYWIEKPLAPKLKRLLQSKLPS